MAVNMFTNFFRAVDALLKSFNSVHSDATTCLRLLITEVVLHTLPLSHPNIPGFQPPSECLSRYPGYVKVLGSDIFVLEIDTASVLLRFPTELRKYPNIVLFVISLVQSCKLVLQPFFAVHLSPSPRIISLNSPALLSKLTSNCFNLSFLLLFSHPRNGRCFENGTCIFLPVLYGIDLL